MLIQTSKAVVALAVIALCTAPAHAQNVQNWLTNQTGQVQQDLSSGLINANQATQLAGREAQIQQQAQQWAAQNGGALTAQQNQQLARELKGVGRRLGNDVHANNPMLNNVNGLPGAYPSPMGYYPNGYMQNSNFMYPPNITGNGMYNGMYPVNGNGAYAPGLYSNSNNPYAWHHHHQWNGF